MRDTYTYDNGISLSEPWRYTEHPVWMDESNSYNNWHRWIPAKIEWRGIEDAYYGEKE